MEKCPGAGFHLSLGSAEMAGLGGFPPGKKPPELHVRAKGREQRGSK